LRPIARGHQHIASAREHLRDGERLPSGVTFLDTPEPITAIATALPGHGEDLARLRRKPHPGRRRAGVEPATAACLLQIFTKTVIGPDLLRDHPAQGDELREATSRLFESIELDQIRRRRLKA